jgi:hypothetical protein
LVSNIEREEHKLKVKVFENRVPREALLSRREEVTGDWSKFRSKELYGFYT